MILSSALIESMGYEPIPAGEKIEAWFHSLHAFEIRGLIAPESDIVAAKANIDGTDYDIAIGRSVNVICQAILHDDYTEDESAWAKEHRCSPPYAVVHFGPTAMHSMSKGHRMLHGREIVTYDAFPLAREELRVIELKALPSIEMALACAFSDGTHEVQVRLVDKTMCGLTSENVTVHDLRLTMNATAHVSTPRTADETRSALKGAVALAASLNPRVSRFFQLGLRDSDSLKRFLYYFLAVEIEVHRVFRTASRAQHVASGLVPVPRAAASLTRLLETRDENWTNLADRFVWCVVSTWVHLDDGDIEEFKKLKKVRDGIAHGDIATPHPASVKAIERLARKIHANTI